jgi:hypothetical protein
MSIASFAESESAARTFRGHMSQEMAANTASDPVSHAEMRLVMHERIGFARQRQRH